MRYMIRAEVSLEVGSKIDRSPRGAGPAIGQILALLKPETFYVSVFKREMFMVVDCDDPAVLSEAAHYLHLVFGCNPQVTPILKGEQTMAILPTAIANAAKAATSIGH